MPLKEWSLIVNSLMVQLATGLLAVTAVCRHILIKAGANTNTVLPVIDSGITIACVAVVTGMAASLFHLGQPLRAPRAITRFSISWLSREVFFTAFLALFCIILVFQTHAGKTAADTPGEINGIWLWSAVISGILSVFSMAGIYRKTHAPGWNGASAYIDFFGSCIILGSISAALIFSASGQLPETLDRILPATILLAFLVPAIRLLFQLRTFWMLKNRSDSQSLDAFVAADQNLQQQDIAGGYGKLAFAGGVLSLIAAVLLTFVSRDLAPSPFLIFMICAFTLAGEIAGRGAFYTLARKEAQNATPLPQRDVYGRFIE